MTDLIQTIEAAIASNVRLEWHGHDHASINPRSVHAAAQAALTAINEAGLVIVPRKDLDLGNTTLAVHGYIPIAAITTGETGQ